MKIVQGNLDGQGLRIAVVTSLFNGDVTLALESGAKELLTSSGVSESNIAFIRVPGAFEIPLAAKALAQSKQFDGIVALGAVIRGETSHYESVCRGVESGCLEIMLGFGIPVGFGILMTDNENLAFDRAGGKQGNKGADAAKATIEMCTLLKKIKG